MGLSRSPHTHMRTKSAQLRHTDTIKKSDVFGDRDSL